MTQKLLVLDDTDGRIKASPISPSGGSNLPEYGSDPVSPANGDTWVLRQGVVGSPLGMLLALTTAKSTYKLSYKTISGTTVRVDLA
jgi:hypothetical protein